MRPAYLFFVAALGAGLSAQAAAPAAMPTEDQQELIAGCGTMAQAVFEFAQARDKGLSKRDAFTAVTGGKAVYGADAQVTETEDWAFDHSDEQAMTAAAHFHGRCVLDAWELLTPISDQQLTNAALTCQQDQAGKPQQIRLCIDRKTTTMVADAAMPMPEATAVVAPPPASRAPKLAMAAAPAGVALAPVPAPPPQATQLAVAPPPTAQVPQAVPLAGVPAAVAIASVPPPPPEATDLAAEAPAATSTPEVAMLTPSAGAEIAAVPAPPPEATSLAAEAPAAATVPVVAMVTPASGAEIAAVSAPVQATDLAAAAPSAATVPMVAMITPSTGAEIAAVPPPPPEATDLAAEAPAATPTAELAMVPAPAATEIASVSVPVAPPAPAPAPVVPVAVAEVVQPPVSPPAVAEMPSPAPAVATSAASSGSVQQLSVASALPVSLSGIGKLSIGMSMADAAKAMGRHGDDDTDAQGNPARSFMISDGHAYIELLTEPGKPDVVYGIEYHGGADAKVPPILGVNLGDDASAVVSRVGEPSSRSPAPLDRTLWAYEGRNYSFEISSGGDLITVRIVGYDGLSTAPSASP